MNRRLNKMYCTLHSISLRVKLLTNNSNNFYIDKIFSSQFCKIIRLLLHISPASISALNFGKYFKLRTNFFFTQEQFLSPSIQSRRRKIFRKGWGNSQIKTGKL